MQIRNDNGINHAVRRSRDIARDWLVRAIHQPEFHRSLSGIHPGSATYPVVIDHVDEAAQGFFSAMVRESASQSGHERVWVWCDLPRRRERLAMELELWGIRAWVMPEPPQETTDGTLADPESAAEWFAVLEALAQETSFVVICPPEALEARAPSPGSLRAERLQLHPGLKLDPEDLVSRCHRLGFERVPVVTSRGQLAVRGGIVDVFGWQAARPLRMEFFDTELESLREFDLDSQASTGKLIRAALMLAEPESDAVLRDYLLATDVRMSVDCDAEADVRICSGNGGLQSEEDFSLAAYGSPVGAFDAGDFVLDDARRELFFRQVLDWKRDGWEIAMTFAATGEEERFRELAGRDLVRDLGIQPLHGDLMAGFSVPTLRMAVLSSAELFGRYRSPSTTRRSTLERSRSSRTSAMAEEMEEGDLVVHYEYGIAKFRGIQDGDDGEELVLEYRDGILLGVPLEQAHLVGKYVGIGGKPPELNRLGGTSWKSARKSAEKSIRDYAAQLLRVQAERAHESGFAHPPDSRWMWEFERSFHFTETTDQRRAIEESKRDLESARPMDRLICGDVGFGKTEVAIRAAFKAATGGKQVAILVPTTVLAEQHWRTFRERMSDYPVRIELLNRFRTPAEVRATLVGLADGSVDIVIGTHRLVSGDVTFKNLGLVVIDEEQRFGVAHKEKFKQLFRQIDVMTLSATPIPRTLYMALMGARDMSTIETPPPNRVPVATSVCGYDERVIRDAIRREMKRGGQVFFLHNRVKSIEMMRHKLSNLVPEARIVVGHGQMDKDDLEVVMRTFVQGQADVLLATTIIETGIDIPNANTILIDRADRFGLADLYQLRGRVGRAGEKAYAILLLPRDLVTGGDARKRIHAIKEYTALGSGFKIAMRDLEIRGAGNLLGTRQSGHIAQIGFELYCQLLRQSVEHLKGKAPSMRELATFRSDFVVTTEAAWMRTAGSQSDGEMLPAFLPSAWLADTQLRVAAYRELATANTASAIDLLEASWRDRFGRIPVPAETLLLIARIKALAANLRMQSVEIQGQRLMLHRNGDYIMLEGRRFPRLKAASPMGRLLETRQMLTAF